MNHYRVMTRFGKQKSEGVVKAGLLSYTLNQRVVDALEEDEGFFTLELTRRNGDYINVIRLSEPPTPANEVATMTGDGPAQVGDR